MTRPRGVVLTYGTFDLFHVGHLRLLKRLAGLGDRLIVGCSTDAFNARKGKTTAVPYAARAEILEGCRYVDAVIAEHCWEQKRADVIRHGADLFAMGCDWTGQFDFLGDLCDVVYLPRTRDVSTTDLKTLIQTRHRRTRSDFQPPDLPKHGGQQCDAPAPGRW